MNATTSHSNELLAAALSYSARGWHVLPLHSVRDGRCTCGKAGCSSAGKHPRTAHGLKDAAVDEQTIRGWWERWRDANIGILTGTESGLVVLDVDPRHGGDVALADLEAEHGRLPDTAESITGGGGRHIFFKHPGGRVKGAADALGPGLALKADGGYVVALPSLHVSGNRYEWEASSGPADVEIAELPAKLQQAVTLKMPDSPVFGFPRSKNARARMLQADLEAAGIPYRDQNGRYADWHALRHTFITNLARAGVHPRVAQSLARHCTITLTMDRYTHVLHEQEVDALSRLPDLCIAPTVVESGKTGTDVS